MLWYLWLIYVCGESDCVECNTEKCHEWTNIGRLWTTQIIITLQYIMLLAEWDLAKFQAAWFLLDSVHIYLWAFWYADCWCHLKRKLRWVWTAWAFGIAVSDLAEDEMYVCFFVVCWCCLRVRCLAVYGLTLGMESYGSKFWIWTGSGPNLWYVRQK